MITFKKFLEGSDSSTPSYKRLTIEKAVELLKANCSDSLWMIKDRAPIWRGDFNLRDRLDDDGFLTVNTAATVRVSENTSNFYTVILDNIPSMRDFPKRGRSFIASMDRSAAQNYGDGRAGTFAIVPFNEAHIGIVNQEDMWDVSISIFGLNTSRIVNINEKWDNLFSQYGIEEAAWTEFLNLSKLLSEEEDKGAQSIATNFDSSPDRVTKAMGGRNLIEYINDAYSPDKTGLYHVSPSDKQALSSELSEMSEVWVSGKIVIISDKMLYELHNNYTTYFN